MSTPETTELLAQRYGESYRWWVAVTVLVGTISAVITTTIVNVAIPDIMGAFGISQELAAWLSIGALTGTTVAMLIQAWLMVHFGPRRTFLGAMLIFVISLLVAGFAPNEFVLIIARVVQGCIAGILQPMAIYMMFLVFPDNRKGQAMGMFGLVSIMGPAIGPYIGGLVIEQFNWRYIFFVGLPTSFVAILLGLVFMPERELLKQDPSAKGAFDLLALVLVATSIALMLVVLSNGQREGWYSNTILGMVAISVICGVLFVRRELRSKTPLVDLRPLAVPVFAATAVLSWIFGAGLFGSIYLVPLFVQTVQGLTPMEAGLLLMPSGLAFGLAMPLTGYLTDRLPARRLILIGLGIHIASSLWIARVDVNTPVLAFAMWVAVGRVGLALVHPALNVAAMRALPAMELGHAAGLVNFFRQLGGAFGVNLLSMNLDRSLARHGDALNAMQSTSNATDDFLRGVAGLLVRSGASVDFQTQGALYYLGQVIEAQAYAQAFRDCFYMVAFAFMLALLPACMLRRAQPPKATLLNSEKEVRVARR